MHLSAGMTTGIVPALTPTQQQSPCVLSSARGSSASPQNSEGWQQILAAFQSEIRQANSSTAAQQPCGQLQVTNSASPALPQVSDARMTDDAVTTNVSENEPTSDAGVLGSAKQAPAPAAASSIRPKKNGQAATSAPQEATRKRQESAGISSSLLSIQNVPEIVSFSQNSGTSFVHAQSTASDDAKRLPGFGKEPFPPQPISRVAKAIAGLNAQQPLSQTAVSTGAVEEGSIEQKCR